MQHLTLGMNIKIKVNYENISERPCHGTVVEMLRPFISTNRQNNAPNGQVDKKPVES